MKKTLFVLTACVSFAFHAGAVDVAPRISDREIIEGLAEVKVLRADMNARFDVVNARFDTMQKEMNTRFDAQQKEINSLRTEMNTRFDGMQKRIDQIHSTMVAFFTVLMAMMTGLVGFVIWDRRTTMLPLVAKVEAVERETRSRFDEHDSTIADSRQLLKALRDLAKRDGSLAEVLRGFNLL